PKSEMRMWNILIAECGLRIAEHIDCGLRIADCGLLIVFFRNPKSEIRNERADCIFPKSEIRNPKWEGERQEKQKVRGLEG
ncbi:MAG: hypothetical protein NTX36_15740, partial [Proteobacteria bacterium]|nr:hypothetical protein [Pseudomonadota bacterium]